MIKEHIYSFILRNWPELEGRTGILTYMELAASKWTQEKDRIIRELEKEIQQLKKDKSL